MSVLLPPDDLALIEVARAAIRARYRPDRHVVGAALRTRAGRLFAGVHLETTVGRIAVCAEAIALGSAATEAGDTEIDTIVAVFRADDGSLPVVAPCGMCREMIADYAPEARVIMPVPGGVPIAASIRGLIPGRFQPPVIDARSPREPRGQASVDGAGVRTSG